MTGVTSESTSGAHVCSSSPPPSLQHLNAGYRKETALLGVLKLWSTGLAWTVGNPGSVTTATQPLDLVRLSEGSGCTFFLFSWV